MFDAGLRILEIPIPLGARIGIEEDRDILNEGVVEREWNGDPILIQSPFLKKAKIRLTASGNGIRQDPAFDGFQPLSRVTLYSRKSSTAYIASGHTSVVLNWSAVQGIARAPYSAALYGTNAPVPVTIVGNVATIEAQADVVCVKYFPVIYCIILRWGGASQINKGTESWSADLEEV